MQAHLMAFSKTQEEPAEQESFPYGGSADLDEGDDEAASSSQQAPAGLASPAGRQRGGEAGEAGQHLVHTQCWGQGWQGLLPPAWLSCRQSLGSLQIAVCVRTRQQLCKRNHSAWCNDADVVGCATVAVICTLLCCHSCHSCMVRDITALPPQTPPPPCPPPPMRAAMQLCAAVHTCAALPSWTTTNLHGISHGISAQIRSCRMSAMHRVSHCFRGHQHPRKTLSALCAVLLSYYDSNRLCQQDCCV